VNILTRAGLIALLVSLTGNGVMWYLLHREIGVAAAEREKAVAEAALSANAQLTESLSHQATAYEARIAALKKRAQLSDAVTKAAGDRAEAAEETLRRLRDTISAENAEYKAWAATKLPPTIEPRMQELNK
jgi:hypothetical protein